jgi:arylsulfatase A-like enzyme
LSTIPRSFLACLAISFAACAEPDPAPRSVLVVVADSMRADHVSAYGHSRATTPRFDAFAARGARFEHTYSQSSWTLPSVASMFTALEQELHGLVDIPERGAPPPPDFPPTLAECFDAAGYRTVAIVQTPVLGGPLGIKRGFDRYTVLDFSDESLRKALEQAYEELEAQRDEPVFVYLHLTPPHMPYRPPEPFRGRFSGTPSFPGGKESVDGSIESCRAVHKAGLDELDPDVVRLAALYDEHVAYADDALGGLIERVEQLAHRRDLVVAWTSDHGEAFMEHGSQGHNATVYEEMIRVPLAIRALDGSIPPATVSGVASLLDLAPTLVELAGAGRWTHPTRGISLVPSLHRGEALPERVLTFSSRHYASNPRRLELGVRRGRHKLVVSREDGRRRLFDLEADPRERDDIAGEHPDLENELLEIVRGRMADWDRIAERPRLEPAPAPADEDELRRLQALRSLGYTDD